MRDHRIGTIKTVDRLLDELLDLESAALERRLADLRAEDAALAAEVERLLVLCLEEPAGLAPGGVLDRSLARECLLGLGAVAELAPGTMIGPYRIEGLIGRGGMSEVYRATRCFEGFSQSVALKLVRSDRVGVDLRERLLSEQRTLVRLDHPNIARFLDAGVGKDGNAYLAMELIDGAPVADYAGAANAGLLTRLRWMIDLCKALAHAHGQLIVHCDIKPSNVLMDAEGRLRLLDFGIARVLEEAVGSPGAANAVKLFTPEYAAPEQVSGALVSTATDIFQAGALLYRLVVGQSWLEGDGRSLADDLDAIVQQAPTAPSERLLAGRLDPKIRANAKACGFSSVDALARKASGDLDAIVLRCLEKDPARRYAGILLLAQDLQAFLDGRPVTARPMRLGYRLAKWVGRHRAVSALAAILVMSVLGFTLALGMQALRLAEARDHARQEAMVANTVLDYLLTMFRAADPARAQGREVSAREMLDLGSASLQDRFAERPEQRERVLRVLGEAYESLGRYPEAERHYLEARSLAEHLAGSAQRRARLETESLLARLDIRQRRMDEARTRLESILAEADKDDEGDRRLRLNALSNLAGVHAIVGPRERAIAISRQVLAERRRLDGPGHFDTLQATNNHAAFLSTSGERTELEEAHAVMLDVLRHAEVSLGEDSPATLEYRAHYHSLGSMLRRDMDSARSLGSVLERLRVVLGERHPKVLVVWRNHAMALDRAGEAGQARAGLEELARVAADVLPATHSDLGFILLQLAETQAQAGEFDAAAANLIRALSTPINRRSVRDNAKLGPLLIRPDVAEALGPDEAPAPKQPR